MCQCNKLWFCFCVILTIIIRHLSYVDSFNVDSFNYAIYGGAETSMFGFSIAVHREGNTGWLIVGAPEAQSTYQQRVRRGGVVYKCSTYQDNSCEEIPFDPKDDNYGPDGNRMDNKTEQWFGATVSSSGRADGPIVACAPRYTWFPMSRRRDPVGTCYVSDEHFSNFNEYAPCRTYHWGYHRQGSCQAGFSAAINHEGDRLFVGAPGSWYWQGQIYSIDAHATFEFKPLIFSATYGSAGQVHQQSLETRPAVFSTTEGPEKDDDSYMGYSMITGDFLGNGEDSIAVGMPRGNDLRGKVLLFTWNLTNFLHHFTSDQLGCYFGYALAASDVDGDGFLDLIVGAPMYTVQNNEGKYDVGRVYVIYHRSQMGKFVATFEIDGFNSKSRFGQALASLNDINQDGYGDFAVGAPYDGPNERGAVYIYHGSNKGVRKTYSQVIYAEDIIKGPSNLLTTFGFSIAGGLDLDGNGYPDMAVGAYLSNKATFFRSRPVVAVDAAVNFLAFQKEIDIKQPNYLLRNGARAVRTQIEYCLKYHGKGIPDYIDLSLQYILDSKKSKSPRMGFVDDENVNVLNDTVRIYKGQNATCLTKDVFVKSDIRDKLTPLVGEMRYWMQDDLRTIYYNEPRNPRSALKPILDLNSPPSRKDSLNIHMECGDDKVCHPNLNLKVASNVNEYLLGSKEPLIFDIIVTNFGEDSYESTLEVKYPDNVYYSKIEDVKVESPVLCNTYENNTLKCEIGNPIPKDKVVLFKIRWQPDYKEGMLPVYKFVLKVNSTNQEWSHTVDDNTVTKDIKVWSDFHLEISGKSQPAEVYVNQSLYLADISNQNANTPFEDRLGEEVIGPQVAHIYYLRNNGPTPIKETELYFIWPSATLAQEDLLYLLDGPHFSPGTDVECDMIPANYRGFNYLRDDRSIWKRLQIKVSKDDDRFITGARVNATISGKVVKPDETLNKAVGESGDSSDVFKQRQKGTDGGTGIGITSGITQQYNRTSFTNNSGTFVIREDGRVIRIDQGGTGFNRFTNSSGTFVIFNDGRVIRIGQGGNTGGGFIQHYNRTSFTNSSGTFVIREDGSVIRVDQGGIGGGFGPHYNIFTNSSGSFVIFNDGRVIRIEDGGSTGDGFIQHYNRTSFTNSSGTFVIRQDGSVIRVDQGGIGGGFGPHYNIITNSSGSFVIFNDGRVIRIEDNGSTGGGFIQHYNRTSFTNSSGTFVIRADGSVIRIDQGGAGGISGGVGPQYNMFTNSSGTFVIYDDGRIIKIDQSSSTDGGFIQHYNRTSFTNSSGTFVIREDGSVIRVDQGGSTGSVFTPDVFKCYDLVNNQLYVVPCQSGTTYRLYRQVGSQQQELHLIRQCFNTNHNGERFPVDCQPEIRSGNLIFIYDKPFIITKIEQSVNTMEKCYDIMNGERIEVDCGPGLRMHNTTFRCFDQINGQLVEVQCESGYTYRYYQRSGDFTNLIRGCYRIDSAGIKQSIECGTEFYRRNILYRFHQTVESGGGTSGSFQSNNFACFESINGNLRTVPCQIGATYKYYRAGLSGYDLCSGCFNEAYSRRQEVPCAANWIRQDIIFQGASTIIRTAISGGGTSQEVNVKIKERCYDLINGVRQEVECSSAHNQTGNISVHSRCYDIIDGRRVEVPCIPGTSIDFTQSFNSKGVINIGGERVHFKCYDREDREVTCSADDFRAGRITYKCFKEVKGGLRPIACSPAAVFQGVGASQSGSSGQSQASGTFYHSSGTPGSSEAYNQHHAGSSAYQSGTSQSGNDPQYQYGGGSASYEYNYEDEDDNKAISSYFNPNNNAQGPGSVSNTGIRQGLQTQGRNPQTYGRSHFAGTVGENSLSNAALNRNFTTTFVDLSDVGTGHGQDNIRGSHSGSSYEQHWSQTHPVAPVYDNYADRDNVPTDRPSQNSRYYGRKKRGAPNRKALQMIMERFPCNSVHCTYMTCRVGLLRANDEVTIAIRSRFNARILKNVTTSQPIRLSSVMAARVSKLPYVSTTEEREFNFHEVHTTIPVNVAEYKPDFVPLWVVVLSAVAGTIILLLLIFLLYKLGFFKRNRPSSAPERQPLNRNGYHHGDEAL